MGNIFACSLMMLFIQGHIAHRTDSILIRFVGIRPPSIHSWLKFQLGDVGEMARTLSRCDDHGKMPCQRPSLRAEISANIWMSGLNKLCLFKCWFTSSPSMYVSSFSPTGNAVNSGMFLLSVPMQAGQQRVNWCRVSDLYHSNFVVHHPELKGLQKCRHHHLVRLIQLVTQGPTPPLGLYSLSGKTSYRKIS